MCRLQAKCEAFIAARFNDMKHCERMAELSKDTWMRLMYISSYKAQGGKEAVLHRCTLPPSMCIALHTQQAHALPPRPVPRSCSVVHENVQHCVPLARTVWSVSVTI